MKQGSVPVAVETRENFKLYYEKKLQFIYIYGGLK